MHDQWIRHGRPALVLAPMEGVTDAPMRALMSERPVVLLIDEIDRADAEFEAFLLQIQEFFPFSRRFPAFNSLDVLA